MDRLTGPLLKVERANEHIRELEDEIGKWRATSPYRQVVYDDPETGKKLPLIEGRSTAAAVRAARRGRRSQPPFLRSICSSGS